MGGPRAAAGQSRPLIEPWCSEDGVRRRQNSVEAKRRKAEELRALRERATAADSMAEVLREAYEGVCYSAASLVNQPDETAEYLGELADHIAAEVPEVLEEEPAQQEEKRAAEDLAWDEVAPAEGDAAAEEAEQPAPLASGGTEGGCGRYSALAEEVGPNTQRPSPVCPRRGPHV